MPTDTVRACEIFRLDTNDSRKICRRCKVTYLDQEKDRPEPSGSLVYEHMLYHLHAYGSGKWSFLGTSHKEQRADSIEERILHLQQSKSLDAMVLGLVCVIAKAFLEQFPKLVRLAKLTMRQGYVSIRSYQAKWAFRTPVTLSVFAVNVTESFFDWSIEQRTCRRTDGGRSRA